MENEINQRIDDLLDAIDNLVWNAEIDLQELKALRPTFYQYLLDVGVLFEEDEE